MFEYTDEQKANLQISINVAIHKMVADATSTENGFDPFTVINYICEISKLNKKALEKQFKKMSKDRKKFEEDYVKTEEKYASQHEKVEA